MEFIKKLQLNHFGSFFNHHYFCFRTSTLMTYMCELKFKSKFETVESSTSSFTSIPSFAPPQTWSRRFWFEKFLHYFLWTVLTLRGIRVCLLDYEYQTSADSNSYLPYYPFVLTLMFNFRFLDATVLGCTCFLALFSIYLDLTTYFYFDARVLWATAELMLFNSKQKFKQINEKLINKNDWWFWWYQALVQKIWFCRRVQLPVMFPMKSFPAMSIKVRVQSVIYSVFSEMVVFILVFVFCKLKQTV